MRRFFIALLLSAAAMAVTMTTVVADGWGSCC
jgi:hypothetical protein